ncbi:MAG: SIS domain-containing protein [Alphaproteobacteria bacterium]
MLARESEGIRAVSEALDGKFVELVEAIAALKGRVIISGMGKSGHIGRKIAATMASTGTPAFFVHRPRPATATSA